MLWQRRTRTKSDPRFIAAVARIQPTLAAWRQQSKHREPMPESLWRAMVGLARRYGVSPVAHTLRVSYAALKDHLEASADPHGSRSRPSATKFVELPMTAWPSGSQWVIEL